MSTVDGLSSINNSDATFGEVCVVPELEEKTMTQPKRGERKKMIKHGSNFNYYLEISSLNFICKACQTHKRTREDFFNSNQGNDTIYAGN